MSKKATDDKQQPTFVDELLKTGTTTLKAATRDELGEMLNDVPADIKYSAGAVGHNQNTGAFELRIDKL